MERYDLVGEYEPAMMVYNDGDWVKYEEAQEEIDWLKEEILKLRKVIENVHDAIYFAR